MIRFGVVSSSAILPPDDAGAPSAVAEGLVEFDAPAAADAGQTTFRPEDMPSWTGGGTGSANELATAAALQEAIDAASADASGPGGRGIVELASGFTYQVRVASNGGGNSSPEVVMDLKDNVTVQGNNATLIWHSWNGFATDSTHHRVLMAAFDVDNVWVENVTLNGNRDDRDNQFFVNRSIGGDGGLDCLSVRNTVSNLTFKNVRAIDPVTDCLRYVCPSHTNILFEDCDFIGASRNGASIFGGYSSSETLDRCILRRCKFNKAGDHPDYTWPGCQPGWGIDVEPDNASQGAIGFTFDDCDFEENQGSVWLQDNQTPTGDTGGTGFRFDCKAPVRKFKVQNCRMTNNTDRPIVWGFRDTPTWDDLTFSNCTCTGNGWNRFTISGIAGSDGGRVTNGLIDAVDSPEIVVEFFPSPYDTGWSLTIDKQGNGQTVTNAAGVSTLTVIP